MSIDPKFVELTADVLEIFFIKWLAEGRKRDTTAFYGRILDLYVYFHFL